jgi:hypothetical protein
MRPLISLVIFCCIAIIPRVSGAAAIYRWRDAAGTLHFSNREEVVPGGASEVTLPPLRERATATLAGGAATSFGVPRLRAATTVEAPAPARPQPFRRVAGCREADADGVANAVATRLGRRALDGLTLLVGGIPVAYNGDAQIVVKGPDLGAQATRGITEQAAIAYPAGSRCPARPPLERYLIASGRRTPSRRLCDDYRRAFAEVGVAVSRDREIARSFRDVAAEFVRVAERGHAAGGRDVLVTVPGALRPVAYVSEERVPLPPWLVEAHIAQTGELGAETSHLVDELTVALEEIDGAARRMGCW